MNLRKISVIGLSACALLFSCNKDTKIDINAAKKYVENNYKLTTAPTAKSGTISWDFKDCNENTAKRCYEDSIYPMLKDKPTTTELVKKGSGEVFVTAAQDYSNNFYLNTTQFDILIKNSQFKNATWYTNNSGLKAKGSQTNGGVTYSFEHQWNKVGGIQSMKNITDGTDPNTQTRIYTNITYTINY